MDQQIIDLHDAHTHGALDRGWGRTLAFLRGHLGPTPGAPSETR